MACQCVKKGKVLNGKWTFWCTIGNQTRVFFVSSSEFPLEDLAHAAVCIDHELEHNWNAAPIAPKGVPGGCIHVDTPVVLKDGSTKRAGDIDVGDEVLSCALEGAEVVARQVIGLWYDYDVELLELTDSAGSSLVTSFEQSVITNSGPVRTAHVFREATIFTLDRTKRARTSDVRFSKREALRNKGNVVSLDLGDDYCFFAGRVNWWMLGCFKGLPAGGGVLKH